MKHHPNMNQSQKVHTTPMNEIPFSFLGNLQVHFNVKSIISGLILVNSKNQKLLSKYLDFMYYQTFFLMKRLHFTKFLTRKSTCRSTPLLLTKCLKQSNFCSGDNCNQAVNYVGILEVYSAKCRCSHTDAQQNRQLS